MNRIGSAQGFVKPIAIKDETNSNNDVNKTNIDNNSVASLNNLRLQPKSYNESDEDSQEEYVSNKHLLMNRIGSAPKVITFKMNIFLDKK
jgi:hypothetical protein